MTACTSAEYVVCCHFSSFPPSLLSVYLLILPLLCLPDHFPCVLQEVWACWCELLSYLEQENAFLDQLEQKLDETDNLQGGAEELQEALDVSMRRKLGVGGPFIFIAEVRQNITTD